MRDGPPVVLNPSSVNCSATADNRGGSMATTTVPLTAARTAGWVTPNAPLVVATDGREQSDAALTAAYALAGDREAVRVLSVLEPMPIVNPEMQIPVNADVIAARRAARKRDVEAELGRVFVGGTPADVEIEDGDPAPTIARIAADRSEERRVGKECRSR